MKRAAGLLLIALALLLRSAAAPAYAYVGQTGTGGESPRQLQTSGEPVVWSAARLPVDVTLNFDDDYDASVLEAMESWNDVGTRLQFRRGSAQVQTCNQDGINAAGWATKVCDDDSEFGDALAITLVTHRFNRQRSKWEIFDADIIVDVQRLWQPRLPGPLSGGVYDFYRVILHELGHVLGLEHPDDAGQSVIAIMNAHVSNLEALQQDDIDGVVYLYETADTNSNESSTDSGRSGGGADLALLPLALLGWGVRRLRSRRAGRRKVAPFRRAGMMNA